MTSMNKTDREFYIDHGTNILGLNTGNMEALKRNAYALLREWRGYVRNDARDGGSAWCVALGETTVDMRACVLAIRAYIGQGAPDADWIADDDDRVSLDRIGGIFERMLVSL